MDKQRAMNYSSIYYSISLLNKLSEMNLLTSTEYHDIIKMIMSHYGEKLFYV